MDAKVTEQALLIQAEMHELTRARDEARAQRDQAMRERDEARRECDELREAGQVTLDEFHIADGKMKAELSGHAVRRLGSLMAYWFEEQGGVNYVEVELCRRAEDGGEHFLFTVQKVGFRTPHQLRMRAEAERDELLRRLLGISRRVDDLYDVLDGGGQEAVAATLDLLRESVGAVPDFVCELCPDRDEAEEE